MTNELNESVDSYISRIAPAAKKDLKFIQANDWSEIENVKTRENSYTLQNLLVDRNIKSAVKLYTLAKASENLDSKRVKLTMELLVSFYTLLNERYNTMIETFDWTKYSMEDEAESNKAKFEVKIQSLILDDVNSLEARLIAINFGGESDNINISLRSEIPIPFLMRVAMEEEFPEIQEHLEKLTKKKIE